MALKWVVESWVIRPPWGKVCLVRRAWRGNTVCDSSRELRPALAATSEEDAPARRGL